MFPRKRVVKTVVFLGVGGVGKTTYIYRVLGMAKTPRVTRKPGVYQMPYGDWELYLVDTPGQYAIEVAQRYYEAVKTFGTRIDLIVYMYSLVEPQTLEALFEIDQWASRYPQHNVILIGNKRDLAEELGYVTEGDDAAKMLGAKALYYTSALRDDPPDLLHKIVENL
ncbi:Rab family GTPase [Pyrobaculum sp.]|uniref:Rab family GTPase n=1 Tax=Pyrobaculum sp. TaxID=2004705 RepID=UPI003D113F59